MDHRDGRVAHEPVGRAADADAAGARRRGAGPAGAALLRIHRAVGHQQRRKGDLRCYRRCSTGASGPHAGRGRRRRLDRGRCAGQGRPIDERHLPPAPVPDLRRQEAEHDRRDGLFGGRRGDGMERSGVAAVARSAASAPGPGTLRPLPPLRPLAGAASRGPDANPAADQLPARPERSRAAGVEGTAPEPVPLLRRRHAEHRRHRRVGGAARCGRGLVPGAAARRPGRMAQPEQPGQSQDVRSSRRGLREGQQGIRHHAPSLDGPPQSRRSRSSCSRGSGRWGAA